MSGRDLNPNPFDAAGRVVPKRRVWAPVQTDGGAVHAGVHEPQTPAGDAVIQRQRRESQAELIALRTRGGVGAGQVLESRGGAPTRNTETPLRMQDLGIRPGPRPPAPTLAPLQIGVSYRTDGAGEQHHVHDKASIVAASRVPGAGVMEPQTMPRILTDERLGMKKPALPNAPGRRASEDDKAAYERDLALAEAGREAFNRAAGGFNRRVAEAREQDDIPGSMFNPRGHANPDNTRYEGLDGLFLTGAPVATPGQRGRNRDEANFNMPATDDAVQEDTTRRNYELEMLRHARRTGMPVLAVCAGSWRLLESYGGYNETLPNDAGERNAHYRPGRDTWNTRHGLQVEPGTMLAGTLPLTAPGASAGNSSAAAAAAAAADHTQAKRRETSINAVNSTHWAVPALDARNQLAAEPPLPPPAPPNSPRTPRPGETPPERRPSPPPPPSPSELRVSATAPPHVPGGRSTVEAFETRHGGFQVGVQWHPESYLPGMLGRSGHPADAHATQQADNLFRGFAQAARAYRGRQEVNRELKARFRRG